MNSVTSCVGALAFSINGTASMGSLAAPSKVMYALGGGSVARSSFDTGRP